MLKILMCDSLNYKKQRIDSSFIFLGLLGSIQINILIPVFGLPFETKVSVMEKKESFINTEKN